MINGCKATLSFMQYCIRQMTVLNAVPSVHMQVPLLILLAFYIKKPKDAAVVHLLMRVLLLVYSIGAKLAVC